MTVNREDGNFKSSLNSLKKFIGYWHSFFYQNIPSVSSYLYSDWQALGCHIWPEMRLEESWYLSNVLIHSRLFFVQDKFVASMTTGHCACLVNRKCLKTKIQNVEKVIPEKYFDKSNYIKIIKITIIYDIEICVDSYC